MDIHIGKPTPQFLGILAGLLALVAIPLTVYQVQQQQDIRQRATEQYATWATTQSASTSCPTGGSSSGVEIKVTFTNTESDPGKAMNVAVKDKQTGKSVNLGKVNSGQTKTGTIATGWKDLFAGEVEFTLTWANGHDGKDFRTAKYKEVKNCAEPSPTPTLPDTTPTSSPSATPCPTLGPVKNIRIDCPNCL